MARLCRELPILLAELLYQARIAGGESPRVPAGAVGRDRHIGPGSVSTRDESGDAVREEGKRGPYAKGLARRAEILEAALETIAERGYHRSTFQEIAERVGVRPGVITHHFGSRQSLMAAIVDARDEADRPVLDALGPRGRMDYLQSNPGLVKLFVNVSAEATDEAHDGHEFFVRRYAEMRGALEGRIRQQQEAGLVDPAVDPAWVARTTMAMIDGLQIQWLYDPSIDMGADLEAFLHAELGARQGDGATH
ncbi:TetR/AcrR family transcriptional regulator [Streptomyces sp. A475]|uniref:TetR/AcrR family transcriptional regulator n=1 Tax=Streptomyces sp. A475 TaxID=3131976 RepID=UPI0030C98EB1